MAKSAFSLHSIQARGTTGKEWVYWIANGIQHRRAYIIPPDPKSPRQQARRAFFKNGMAYWTNLPGNEKAEYNETAKVIKTGWIGYNYFIQKWLRGEIVTDAIKSIQRGSKACVDGVNNVTIVAVTMARSVVICPGYVAGLACDSTKSCGIHGANLTSDTNLRIFASKGAAGAIPTAYWQVVEFF